MQSAGEIGDIMQRANHESRHATACIADARSAGCRPAEEPTLERHDELKTTPAAPSAASDDDATSSLTFEDNRLASALYGDFDQNLALIEQRLGVDTPRGNH